jgi:hypothetical protein
MVGSYLAIHFVRIIYNLLTNTASVGLLREVRPKI